MESTPQKANAAAPRAVVRDVALGALSVVLAVVLARMELTTGAVAASRGWVVAGSFLAGLLFSSAFTAAPAAVVLVQMAQTSPVWEVAAVGALGSVVGNLFVYRLFHGRVAQELDRAFTKWGHKDWLDLLRNKHFHWLSIVCASILIVTPLPDELGIALLGISGASAPTFAAVSYVTNALCILVVCGIAGRFA